MRPDFADDPSLPEPLADTYRRLLRDGERWRSSLPDTSNLLRVARHLDAATTRAAIPAQLPAESPFVSGEQPMEFDDQPSHFDLATLRPVAVRNERHSRRHTGIMASVAAILLIALGATIFALRPHQGSTTPGTNTHIQQSPTSTPLPISDELFASDILSPDNIWAIGYDPQQETPAVSTPSDSQVFHFDGSQWHIMANYPNTDLRSISMDSATDGWVVGFTGSEDASTTKPLLLHYTGGHLVTVAAPNTAFRPWYVKMFSATDGWLFGHEGGKEVAFHDINGGWREVTLNFPILSQIQMLSDTEGWATYYSNQNSTLLRYHDGQWSEVTPTTNPIQSLGANSATDVWLVVNICGAPVLAGSTMGYASLLPATKGYTGGPITCERFELLHYDGSRWTTVQEPASAAGNAVGFIDGGQWLVVDNTTVALKDHILEVLHYQNSQWLLTTIHVENTNVGLPPGILGFASQPDGSALALTQTLGIANRKPVSTLHVFRYSNGTWTIIH